MAAAKLLPKDVADAFVRQYYAILDRCPENLHRFYQESSLLGWPGPDGNVTSVTTATGISNKVLASDHIKGHIDVKSVDAQYSIDGAIIVVVTGSMTLPDVKKSFSHTFFLAKQRRGFFVLNDILRYFDGGADSAGKSDQADTPSVAAGVSKNHWPISPSKASGPCKKNSQAALPAKQKSGKTVSSDTKAAVESRKTMKEVVMAKVTAAKSAATPSADSKSAQSASDKTPTPVAAPLVNFNIKISYASVVAKEVPAPPPTASNAQKQTKPSAPTNTVLKTAARLSAAPKESAPLSKGNSATSAGANGEGVKGIYIGRLPYEITKQGIVNVIKQFGAIRRGADSVQIRRHEDGFCCGFVEFESADAARRAVEAHHVWFNDRDSSYIMFKRSTPGGDVGRRSPPRGSSSGNLRGREMEPARNKGKAQNGGRRGV